MNESVDQNVSLDQCKVDLSELEAEFGQILPSWIEEITAIKSAISKNNAIEANRRLQDLAWDLRINY